MATKTTKKEVKKDIGYYASFVALANSEGGRNYLKLLKSDVLSVLDGLCANYAQLSQNELVARISLLKVRLDTYRLFLNAPTNQADAEAELTELLKTDPEDLT